MINEASQFRNVNVGNKYSSEGIPHMYVLGDTREGSVLVAATRFMEGNTWRQGATRKQLGEKTCICHRTKPLHQQGSASIP